jgi:hypothetical protein
VGTHASNRALKELGLIPLEPNDDVSVVIEQSAIRLVGVLASNPNFGARGGGLTQARQAALCVIMVRAAGIIKNDVHKPGPPGGETYFERAMREHPESNIVNPMAGS